MQWQPINTAPFDRDLELAVLDRDAMHALVFPCRRSVGTWINAQTKRHIWSRLPLLVHNAIALLPPGRTAQLPHDGMTLKLGSRGPVLVDSVEVPAASANVPDKHVDVVEDDPAPAAIGDDAIPHVCDSQDDGAQSISGTTPFLVPISILAYQRRPPGSAGEAATAGGGNGRSAAMAPRIFCNKSRGTITSAI